MKNTSKSTRSDRNRQMIAGLQKHFAEGPTITLDGVSYKPADVEKILQDSIDAAGATGAAAAAFHKAVSAEQAAAAKGNPVYRAMRAVLVNQYKSSPDTLADFGVTLPTKQTPSAATAAGAVVKRNATRAARHTMGKRQKAPIKGTVPAATSGPTPSPANGTKPTA